MSRPGISSVVEEGARLCLRHPLRCHAHGASSMVLRSVLAPRDAVDRAFYIDIMRFDDQAPGALARCDLRVLEPLFACETSSHDEVAPTITDCASHSTLTSVRLFILVERERERESIKFLYRVSDE